ncbi:BUD32 family EKC/KEOPS complex subunit [Aliihoeflea sp. PC F10.4]
MNDARRLLDESRGKRISSARVRNRTVWIKHFDAEARPFLKRMHARLSRFAPITTLRASPYADAPSILDRETRKTAAFKAAGFPVAEILHAGDNALIMSDAAPSVSEELARRRQYNLQEHDALLIEMAETLARAHMAGLCHGRPHPRDLFLTDDGRIGFLDFEEEPEAVMPLEAAQARDAWLIFMHVGGRGMLPETEQRAVGAYVDRAPAQTVSELRRFVRFFTLLTPVLKALRPIKLGNDGKRALATTELLRKALPAAAHRKTSGTPANTTDDTR